MKKGGAFGEQPPFKTTGIAGTKDKKMIIYFSVNLNKLVELGRKYPWSKPKGCLNCIDDPINPVVALEFSGAFALEDPGFPFEKISDN
ncbi:MAG: hypothetical protein EHM38_04050 [Geobacteraceae bacterium]|nr:MAG: hypothetical protein EHM38_04050 [Geobacteraceae bacterium]